MHNSNQDYDEAEVEVADKDDIHNWQTATKKIGSASLSDTEGASVKISSPDRIIASALRRDLEVVSGVQVVEV